MTKVKLTFETNAPLTAEKIKKLNDQVMLTSQRLGEVDRVTLRVTGRQQDFGSAIKSGIKNFLVYSVAIYGSIKALNELKEFVGDNVNKFREFQLRMAEVSTIMDTDFYKSIKGLQAGVEELAVEFGKNTSDMAKGLYDILSSAFDAKDAIALLADATKASVAGLSDIRTSVDIFTTVLNSYGMSVYEASRVSDMLFQSVIRGKFQFENLERALGYVVPIASQAGISLQELLSALSTTTRHGLHLDMTARGLALAIQNIINPSEGAKKKAEELGIALDAVTLRTLGLVGYFKMINEKTKEFGSTILADIIPNMRSLRVAMVLAGDEGIQGMVDDFDLLSASVGRTDQALQKIQQTSQFVSNQIKQQFEKAQRDIGQSWDKIVLGIQSGTVSVLKDWTSFLPIIGSVFSAIKAVHKRELLTWETQKNFQYHIIQGEQFRYDTMKKYLKLQDEIANLSQTVNTKFINNQDYEEDYKKLMFLQQLSGKIKDSFDRAFGEPILGGIRHLDELKQTMIEIETSIRNLQEELEKPIKVGWGSYAKTIKGTLNLQLLQLKATQKRVDYEHDVQSALKLSNYEWKTHNEELKRAVEYVKNYTKAQEELQEKLKKTNNEMKKLELEALKIQLKGMLRRRGLTRNEEIKLKKIQIEQTKLRISQMEEQVKAMTKVDETEYNKRKEFIDDFLNKLREEEYQAKYTYDQQILDLQTHINSEKKLLEERYEQWKTKNDEIIQNAQNLVDSLKTIMSDEELNNLFRNFGINIEDLSDKVNKVLTAQQNATPPRVGGNVRRAVSGFLERTHVPPIIRESILKHIPHFQRGGYVPETTLAVVHKGEYISPAGASSGANNFNISVHINAVTKEGVTADEIADKVATAIQQRLIDYKSGRTRYRLR